MPVARIAPAFFALATGVAGAVVQKFVNYRLRLVVVGDVTEHVAASTALRDFVREANRGRTDVVRRGRGGAGGTAALIAARGPCHVGQVTVRTVGAVGNDGPVDSAGEIVAVVGIGADGWAGLAEPGRAAVRAAEVLLGGPRQLELVAGHTKADARPWPSPMLPALPGLVRRAGRAPGVRARQRRPHVPRHRRHARPGARAGAAARRAAPLVGLAGLRPAGLAGRRRRGDQRGRPAAGAGPAGARTRGPAAGAQRGRRDARACSPRCSPTPATAGRR